LHNLSQANYNAEMIIKQSGMQVVMEVMQELNFDAELIEVALCLLFNLSQIQDEVDIMLDEGLVKTVNMALSSHGRVANCATTGVRVLGNLSFNEDTGKRVFNNGAVDTVMEVTKLHTDGDLLKTCYSTLSNICRAEECAVAMAASTNDLAERQLKKNRETYNAVSGILAYISNLCVHSGASQELVNTNIVETILEVAHDHLVKNPNIIKRACRCLENMSYASQKVRDNLKERGAVEGLQRWTKAIQDDVKHAAQAAIDAINRTETDISAMKVVSMGPLRAQKSAKDLFGDTKVQKVPTLSKETRNFLQSGTMLMKHSKTAAPRPRHVYVTEDLKWLIWKDPKKAATADTRLKLFKVREIKPGRCTKQLMRKTLMGQPLAKDECAFAIFARDRESLDLECDCEADRQKWITCLEEAVAYIKAAKEATKFSMN
jgi:hypothetical protein